MMQFILNALLTTLLQLFNLFSLIFIIGFAIYFIEKKIFKMLGWKKAMWTAWLGTPIHELGHAIFCLLFGHKITEIKFFKPDPVSGVLGYVNHSYNPNSLYQNIGNLFIGAGPLFFGSAVVYLLTITLLPNISYLIEDYHRIASSEINDKHGIISFIVSTFEVSYKTLLNIFAIENLKRFEFWIYLYIMFCISTHIAPSIQDFKGGVIPGLITLALFLFFVNIINEIFVIVLGTNLFGEVLSGIFIYQGNIIGLMLFSLILVVINFLITTLLKRLKIV
jgi:hypothetical protein